MEDDENEEWRSMVENGRNFYPHHIRPDEEDLLIDDGISFGSEHSDSDSDSDNSDEIEENYASSDEEDFDDNVEEEEQEQENEQENEETQFNSYNDVPDQSLTQNIQNSDGWFSYSDDYKRATKNIAIKSKSSLPVFQSEMTLKKNLEKNEKSERKQESNEELEQEQSVLESNQHLPQIIASEHAIDIGILRITKKNHNSLGIKNTPTEKPPKQNGYEDMPKSSSSFLSSGPMIPSNAIRRREPSRLELFCVSIVFYILISSTLSRLDNDRDMDVSAFRGTLRAKMYPEFHDGKQVSTWSPENQSNTNYVRSKQDEDGRAFMQKQSNKVEGEQIIQQHQINNAMPHKTSIPETYLWEDADITQTHDDMISTFNSVSPYNNRQDGKQQQNLPNPDGKNNEQSSHEQKGTMNQDDQKQVLPLPSAPLSGGHTSSIRDELRPIEDVHNAKDGDMPIYWLVPPNSPESQSVHEIIDTCFDLTRAEVDGPSGAHHIAHLAGESEIKDEDIIVTSNLFELESLLNPNNPIHQRGLMFTFLIHPVERAALMFEYLKSATYEPSYHSNLASMTLLEYARERASNRGFSSKAGVVTLKESNFLVRSLAQVPLDVPLHGGHVAHAEQVLRKFCVLGLMENEEMILTSWRRIQKLNGWAGDEKCIKMLTPSTIKRRVPVDSEEYKLLAEFNEYDLIFYDNIKNVFEQQGMIPMFKNL